MNGKWHNQALLISISAVFFNAALYISWLHWLVFISFIPLFIVVLQPVQHIGSYGFAWGLIYSLLHWIGLWYFIIHHGTGPIKIGCIIFLSIYYGFTAAGWFWLGQILANRGRSQLWHIIAWVGASFLFFLWARYGMFIIFGHWFGDPFILPLLPLMHASRWLYWLPLLGGNGLLGCLIAWSVVCAAAIREQSWHYFMVACIFFLPFTTGWLITPQAEKNTVHTPKIVMANGSNGDSSSPVETAQLLNDQLVTTVESYGCGDALVVIFPESAFPFALNEYKQLLELLHCPAYIDELWVILGAHRKEGALLRNSLFVIHNASISQYYDKNFLMPFTEYIPFPWNLFSFMRQIFLSEKRGFAPARENFSINVADHCFYPSICADFFLSNEYARHLDHPLVCLLNDSWFSRAFLCDWMVLFARYQALEWSQEIFYVGYQKRVYIDKKGKAHTL